MRGFTKRQPSTVSATAGVPRANASPGFSITYGARLIDSTPPATKTSPSPARIAWNAAFTAWRPEPHRRFTVWPGTLTGRPASRPAIRAMLRLSSPAWFAQPRMTSSMRARSMPVRSSTARIAVAARSSGRTPASAPPWRPIGVRTASTIQASRVMRPRTGARGRCGAAPRAASAQVDPYALDLGVQLERVEPELAALARLLVAAERGCRIERMVRVDPDGPRLQSAGDAVRALHVPRPDPGGEPVDRLVGERNGLLLITERHRHQDGAEDLFLRDRRTGIDALEDRRLDPVTLFLALVERALAAQRDVRTVRAAALDVAEDPLELLARDQRPVAPLRVERIARLQRAGTLHELLDDLVVHRLVHQQPRARRARLPRVVGGPRGRGADRGVDVRVVENDVGALAAQLERNLLQRAGRLARDDLAHGGRARERDLVDVGMPHQRSARHLAEAGHHVEHARRQADLGADGGELERGERRLLGRLEDDRVTAGQRGGNLPRGHLEREVP